jgi:predicted lipoprotein
MYNTKGICFGKIRVANLSLFLGLFFCYACEPTKDSCAANFDKAAFLSNTVNNIITPRYDSLKNSVDKLQTAIQNFCNNPAQNTLDTAQGAYFQAGIQWQRAMIFEFGPAENIQLRAKLNNFPVFVNRLEYAVQSNNYNLEIDSFSFTRGFPAIDYLLYGVNNSEVEVLDSFISSSNRRQFLLNVVNQIQNKVDQVVNEWNIYKNNFVSNTAVSTGSPTSLLVNQLNQNYELLKNNKLGIPVGAKVSYIPAPEKTEAYYSGFSTDFALASLYGMYELFSGRDGIGLDDYIASTAAEKEGQLLQNVITNQFSLVYNGLEALKPNSLATAIRNDFNTVKTIYGQAQNQVVYLKTDLPSVICVSITYIDNTDDGD